MSKQSFILASIVAATSAAIGCGGSGSGTQLGTNTNTVFTIKFELTTPAVVAEKIGDGAWAAASPQGGALNLNFPAGMSTYGIAYFCPENLGAVTFNNELIIEATVQDGMNSVPGCPATLTPARGSISGTVDASAISGVSQVVISAPLGGATVTGITGTFNFPAQTGTDDIVFAAMDAANNILAIKIVRSQTVPGIVNSGNVVTLSASDATTSETLAVTNLPPGFTAILPSRAMYTTSNRTIFALSNNSSSQYAVVPSSEAQAGDTYQFLAEYAFVQLLISSDLRTATASAVTLPLPAPLPLSAPTATEFPTFSFNYSAAEVENYLVNLHWLASQNVDNLISVNATAAYQTGATNVSVPDLTAIPGFLSPANSGTVMGWDMNVAGGTAETNGQSVGTGSIWIAGISGSYMEP